MYRFRSEDGVPGALIIWAVFIILFWIMGVPALLSILLGTFGGIAVGFLLIYWRAEEDTVVAVEKTDDSPIRPMRRLIERFPLSSGFAWNRTPPKRITGDSSTGEPIQGEGKAIRGTRSGSSFRDAVKRRKEGS